MQIVALHSWQSIHPQSLLDSHRALAGGATALEGPDGGAQPAATAAGAKIVAVHEYEHECCSSGLNQYSVFRHPSRWSNQ